ncbi:MarR family transcriptional regulator [Jiella endophytica]|uniref:MarR family transcriptional regulator n=1 Tax=Jiella endophytica TaxID=2558362 RepID=A0A4Y8RVN8_9HYPH|nr:Lrp/AsnC family transcriptional regulator [Jiella endophytica]TFF27524.1 MarR family transcriptional regulator [Jiella endophytica]
MGRGLSPLQRNLLAALEHYSNTGNHMPAFARAEDLIKALGLKNTASTQAATSRALRRLAERGLITIYVAKIHRQGPGYRYGPRIG